MKVGHEDLIAEGHRCQRLFILNLKGPNPDRSHGDQQHRNQHGQLGMGFGRSEEHTSELQSRLHLVCRLLLEKKKKHKYAKVAIKKTMNSKHHESIDVSIRKPVSICTS